MHSYKLIANKLNKAISEIYSLKDIEELKTFEKQIYSNVE